MPPSSRGSESGGGRYNGNGASTAPDPLTAVIQMMLFPILLLLFVTLHVVYDVCTRISRVFYYSNRTANATNTALWRRGSREEEVRRRLGSRAVASRATSSASFAPYQLEMKDSRDALNPNGNSMRSPRHIAITLRPPPQRTRGLLLTLAIIKVLPKGLLNLVRGRRSSNVTTQGIDDERYERYRSPKSIFLKKSVEELLRCCALIGTQEVTIFDSEGILRKELLDRKSRECKPNNDAIEGLDLSQGSKAGSFGSVGEELKWRFPWNHSRDVPILSDSADHSPTEEVPRTPESNTTPSFTSAGDWTPKTSSEDGNDWIDKFGSEKGVTVSFHAPSYRRPFDEAEDCDRHLNGHIGDGAIIRANILGPEDAKSALAHVASSMLGRRIKAREELDKSISKGKGSNTTVKGVEDALKDQGYPSEPDLVIIHGGPRRVRSLHGFPPWLVRICEISYDEQASPYEPFKASSFELAIQKLALAEQRLGK